uniref:NADH-ubiquinone oxidoreductase chain 1 n=1 Tax=Schistocephalus solidus TaxID=70667 RepID=A0A183SW94_SCHSO
LRSIEVYIILSVIFLDVIPITLKTSTYKLPLCWMLLEWAHFMATFPFISKASFMNVLYPIWVFVLFFTMAENFVLMPVACTNCFGSKNMAKIYGFLYLATVSVIYF